MSKSMSVTFADGTSHTYDNIPDHVTQDQVNSRAKTDYPDKTIKGIGEGAHPLATNKTAATSTEPSLGQKALGMAMVPFQAIAEHPAVAGAALGGYKAYQLGKNYITGKQTEATAANEVARTNAEAARMEAEAKVRRAEVDLENSKRHAETQANKLAAKTGVAPVAPSAITPTIPTAPTVGPVNPNMIQAAANEPFAMTHEEIMRNADRALGAPAERMPAPGAPAAAPGSNFAALAKQYGAGAVKALPGVAAGYEGFQAAKNLGQGNVPGAIENTANAGLNLGAYLPGVAGLTAGGAALATHAGNLNTGEEAKLNEIYPGRADEAERNRLAIAQAGRQPKDQADLEQMIRDAAARAALTTGQ